MTDQTATEDLDVEGEAGADEEAANAPRRRKLPGKKIVLFMVLPIVLLAAAGGGIYFSGLADSFLGKEGEPEMLAGEPAGPSVFYDMPELLVNLNTNARKTGYLKLSVSLELGSEDDRERVDRVLPRIVDNFQVYLRELRVEDLRGSAGLQRLREELLLRVSSAAQPIEVRDVLFREMLIQ